LKALPAKKGGLVPSAENLKLEDKLMSARRHGMSTNHQPEKETSFRISIQMLEKLCVRLRPYRIEAAYAEYERYKTAVEKRRARLEQKYSTVIHTLRGALQPVSAFGEKLAIYVDEIDKLRGFSRSGDEFVYNRYAAKACQETLRKKGVLPFIVQELKPLSRAAAMEDDGEGHFKVNPEKQVEAVFQMLDNFLVFCRQPEAPRKLIRESVDRIGPKVKLTTRKGGFGKREMVAGLYVVGTSGAFVYQTLLDGEWHDIAEMQKSCSANLMGRIKRVERDGRQHGWTIEFQKWGADGRDVRVRMVTEVRE
jgi:hypothetical protein